MTAVVSLVDRPGLLPHLTRRGLTLAFGPAALLLAAPVAPDALAQMRAAYGAAAILALAQDDAHQIALLDAGVEDVAPQQASDAVLAARLASLAQRVAPPGLLRIGALAIDTRAGRVMREDRPLDLLPREYALLRHLAEASDRVVSARELLAKVWGLGFDPGTNVVAVHVSRLRAKLDRRFAQPMLLTERGAGYRLVSAGAAA